ncbi:MAG: hypothetical protein ACREN6_07045 [Gemmatimonadaceae bacterium]
MMLHPSYKRVFAFSALAFITACGSGMLDATRPPLVTVSGGGGGGGSATYTGAVADSLHRGSIALTVSSASSVTGLLTFVGGPTIAVTGSADSSAATMTASGSGYTVTGDTHTGTVQGTYTGPGGNGFFAATADTLTQMTHTTYCGTYTSSNGNGWFSVVALSDGESAGFAVQTLGSASSATFLGTLDFTLLTFAATTTQAVQATGTVSSDLQTIIGSYAPSIGGTTGTGTFSVTTGGC